MRIVHLLKPLLFILPLLAVSQAAPPIVDWPARVQRPHEHLPVKDLGLAPLLRDEADKPITTASAWKKKQDALTAAWLERLGKPRLRGRGSMSSWRATKSCPTIRAGS